MVLSLIDLTMPLLQGTVQGFCSKVSTVLENMILTGEGEELVREGGWGAGEGGRVESW